MRVNLSVLLLILEKKLSMLAVDFSFWFCWSVSLLYQSIEGFYHEKMLYFVKCFLWIYWLLFSFPSLWFWSHTEWAVLSQQLQCQQQRTNETCPQNSCVWITRQNMIAIIFGALKYAFFGSDFNELRRNGGWGLFTLPTRCFDMRILKWKDSCCRWKRNTTLTEPLEEAFLGSKTSRP